MSKIRDIKKKHPKHVDVKTDNEHEEHIEIHRSQNGHDPTETQEKAEETTLKQTPKEVHEDARNEAAQEEQADTKKRSPEEPIRVVFMGTGHFAGQIIKRIQEKDECEIIQVITQPNKKIGRKKSSIHRTLAPNPVRDFAVNNEIDLLQPKEFDDNTIREIKEKKPDMIVVAAYGRILPKSVLLIPKLGAINVHASLLPKLRGASPAQNALLLGMEETGVTIMQMDEGLDTGDILAQKKTSIAAHERADELLDKLSHLGADLLIETAPEIIDGSIEPIPQDHKKATLCQLIDREDGHIQWTQTTEEIYNRFRALYPWPGIFSYWEEKENRMMRIKWRSVIPFNTEDLTDDQNGLLPGTIFIGKDQLCIKTSDGALIVEALQPECKVVMPVYDFLNGHKDFKGSVLR